MPEATTTPATATPAQPRVLYYVCQWRWVGDDDWTNNVFIGATEAEVEQEVVDAIHAETRDELEYALEGKQDRNHVENLENWLDLETVSQMVEFADGALFVQIDPYYETKGV